MSNNDYFDPNEQDVVSGEELNTEDILAEAESLLEEEPLEPASEAEEPPIPVEEAGGEEVSEAFAENADGGNDFDQDLSALLGAPLETMHAVEDNEPLEPNDPGPAGAMMRKRTARGTVHPPALQSLLGLLECRRR